MSKPFPFPGNQDYTPVLRRFLQDINQQRDGNNAEIYNLQTRMQETESDVITLQTDVAGIKAVNSNQDIDISALQQNVSSNADSIITINNRLSADESTLNTHGNQITALQYSDSAINDSIAVINGLIGSLQGQINNAVSSYKLVFSDSVLGTVSKLVGSIYIPSGTYIAPKSELGCPATTYTATLLLKKVSDNTTLATISNSGVLAWATAISGFSLSSDSQVDLLLSSSDVSGLAVIKGLEIEEA